MNSGIFLDQRENRKEIRGISHGKKVLNLFSYTCGFSVCAALGGASEVVSVDTSPHSLEWGKKNFSLNQLQPERYEFFTADALFFLESCKKRARHFDIIVLDPPTFSRGKKGIFKLREKLEELVFLSLACLEHQGILLLTFNDEELDLSTAAGEIEKAAKMAGVTYMEVKKIRPPLDFEFPLERETVFKGFWLQVAKT
jgi:23S rRNA (cytosine1962-C5)-methyltransferase